MVSVTQGFRRERASANEISLPGTYLMSTSYFWIRYLSGSPAFATFRSCHQASVQAELVVNMNT